MTEGHKRSLCNRLTNPELGPWSGSGAKFVKILGLAKAENVEPVREPKRAAEIWRGMLRVVWREECFAGLAPLLNPNEEW